MVVLAAPLAGLSYDIIAVRELDDGGGGGHHRGRQEEEGDGGEEEDVARQRRHLRFALLYSGAEATLFSAVHIVRGRDRLKEEMGVWLVGEACEEDGVAGLRLWLATETKG